MTNVLILQNPLPANDCILYHAVRNSHSQLVKTYAQKSVYLKRGIVLVAVNAYPIMSCLKTALKIRSQMITIDGFIYFKDYVVLFCISLHALANCFNYFFLQTYSYLRNKLIYADNNSLSGNKEWF